MKQNILLIFIFGFILLLSCSSSADKNPGKEVAKGPTANESSSADKQPPDNNQNEDGIIGDWALQLETYDDNGNHLLDEAERKKAFSNHYFYRFNADGSCLISPFAVKQIQSAFKGRYDVTEKNGKKIITTYWDETDQKGQKEAQYSITSVNKNELVLLETTGNHTFWIFKRA